MTLSFSAQSQIMFEDDFDSYVYPPDGLGLGGDWLVGATALADNGGVPGGFVYNYFAFPAPNGGPGFSSTESLDGSDLFLNVYNDYNNVDHGNGLWIEALVFQEATIGAGDVDQVFEFTADHMIPTNGFGADLSDPRTHEVSMWVKVLDPGAGFATVYFDNASTAADGTSTLSVTLDPSWEGLLLQWGFSSTATGFGPTGVWYNNASARVVPPLVPTMGEWGVICLSIGMMIFGVVAIRREDFVLN